MTTEASANGASLGVIGVARGGRREAFWIKRWRVGRKSGRPLTFLRVHAACCALTRGLHRPRREVMLGLMAIFTLPFGVGGEPSKVDLMVVQVVWRWLASHDVSPCHSCRLSLSFSLAELVLWSFATRFAAHDSPCVVGAKGNSLLSGIKQR